MTAFRTRPAPACRRVAGFSVVELLVAVAVGLVLTLAVTGVLLRNEGRSRDTLAVNDINQSGAFVAYLLDNMVRSAGSGFANRWAETYGCRLNASRAGSAILPRTSAWPAPFAGFPQAVRVAPLIIGKSQSASGSDVIAVMRGNAGIGEAPLEVLALGPPLGLRNTIGLAANDLLLLADGETDCLLLQAGTTTADTVALTGAGDFHTTTGTNRSLTDFGTPTPSTVAVNLGNAGASGGTPTTAPQFTLYAVGANRTLFARDMLDIDGGAVQPLADGVVEMRALYGLDTDNNGTLDQWADPGVAPFNTASLMSGSAAAVQNLNSIIAVRIGLVLRTSQREREVVAPATLTLFGDLDAALQQTRTLTTDERKFRHRTTEVTVPLRNVLLSRAP
jgi:type IV pilus assembly protein PilW